MSPPVILSLKKFKRISVEHEGSIRSERFVMYERILFFSRPRGQNTINIRIYRNTYKKHFCNLCHSYRFYCIPYILLVRRILSTQCKNIFKPLAVKRSFDRKALELTLLFVPFRKYISLRLSINGLGLVHSRTNVRVHTRRDAL